MATLMDYLLLATAISAMSPPPPDTTTATHVCPKMDQSCGDGVEIRYPFWVGTNISGCGYPSLRLECRGGTTVLSLPSGEYVVTSIHYDDKSTAVDHTLTLFDLSIVRNDSCPNVAGRNLTLPAGSPSPLSLTNKNTNITFYTGCNFAGLPTKTMPCLESADGLQHTYVFGDSDPAMQHSYAVICEEVVGVPVLRRPMSNSTTSLDDIMASLSKGFELRWSFATGGECGDCERVGGFCGFKHQDKTGKAFECFTQGGPKFTTRAITAFVVMPAIPFVAIIAIIMINLGMCGAQP